MSEPGLPTISSDPVEQLIERTPITGGRPPFCLRYFVQTSESSARFQLHPRSFLLLGVLCLISVLAILGFFLIDGSLSWFLLAVFVLAEALTVVAIFTMPTGTTINLDKGILWQGWSQPPAGSKDLIPVSTIHALQVVKGWRGPNERQGHFIYELNMLLEDGSRRNLNSHRRHRQIYGDGKAMARFLGIPLWDHSVK